MQECKGEIWDIYMLREVQQDFIFIGQTFVDYNEMEDWLIRKKRSSGWVKEWLGRFAKEHNLVGHVLDKTFRRYVRNE